MDGQEDDFKRVRASVPDHPETSGEGEAETARTDDESAAGTPSQRDRLGTLVSGQVTAPYFTTEDRPTIFRLREGRDPEPVCGWICVVGNIRATNLTAQGLRIVFETNIGEIGSMEISRNDLHRTYPKFIDRLSAMGFLIYCTVSAFLAFMRTLNVLDVVPSAQLSGWAPSMKSYALRSGEIIAGADLDEEWLPIARPSKAELVEWWNRLGYLMRGNSILMFAVFAALAGCLLRILGKDGLFFHWAGPSGSGKTLILKFVSTLFRGLTVSSWQDTPQALTDQARAATDSTVLIDDTQPVSARKLATVIMTLGSGLRPTTRGEMNSSTTAANDRSFYVAVQSTGETMISSTLSQAGLQRDGHSARVLDIPVDRETIARELHEAASSYAFVKQIENALGNVPRVLGPMFVQLVLDTPEEKRKEWPVHYQKLVNKISQELFTEDQQREGVYLRGVEQIAVVEFAGQFLVQRELLPITSEEVKKCVRDVSQLWATEAIETAVPEPDRVCHLVKQWVVKNEHRLIEIDETGRIGRKRSRHFGFRDDDAYYLTPDALAAAGAGQIEPRRMAGYLDQANWLDGKQSAQSLQHKLYLAGNTRVNVYKIPRLFIDTE